MKILYVDNVEILLHQGMSITYVRLVSYGILHVSYVLIVMIKLVKSNFYEWVGKNFVLYHV